MLSWVTAPGNGAHGVTDVTRATWMAKAARDEAQSILQESHKRSASEANHGQSNTQPADPRKGFTAVEAPRGACAQAPAQFTAETRAHQTVLEDCMPTCIQSPSGRVLPSALRAATRGEGLWASPVGTSAENIPCTSTPADRSGKLENPGAAAVSQSKDSGASRALVGPSPKAMQERALEEMRQVMYSVLSSRTHTSPEGFQTPCFASAVGALKPAASRSRDARARIPLGAGTSGDVPSVWDGDHCDQGGHDDLRRRAQARDGGGNNQEGDGLPSRQQTLSGVPAGCVFGDMTCSNKAPQRDPNAEAVAERLAELLEPVKALLTAMEMRRGQWRSH
jgi:hypothetical protein